ncbi:uncharacterized protein TRAVEDRAFT_50703 [Trametes versicolor FP-101664 SS1]|uniref:uncharacterized protein n=1 Tax=Trametes versicolor (strain FP-101664) TaxID=717944 RepID=UPI0004621CB0|nr:uncharacterized protein TRAVEDRAFT_50703 [Trametes versicolor FP-101664 SS1]EIW56221.1 hypothetical protein TRAVEDRAFT_50703 [Trametes versicolor FP-101664 SS1]
MARSMGLVTPTEKAVLEPHPELYFDNGDIIYCVHTSLLSFHSVVFSNLFADGSGKVDSPHDGRPVVLMPDEAGDLSQLLSYVYKPSEYLLRPSHPDTPIELRGAVKLAEKYLFDGARADMIKRVTMDWPVTLDEWDIRASEFQGLRHVVCSKYFHRRRTTTKCADTLADRVPEPISTILFAQEHGCTDILPAAFYRLASIDTKRMTGPRTEAARRQALEEYHRQVAFKLSRGAMISKNCIPLWLATTFGPADDEEHDHPPEEETRKEYPCLDFLWTLSDAEWGTTPTYEPLSTLLHLDNEDKLENVKQTCPNGLCIDCQFRLRSWVKTEREALWERLPTYFDLHVTTQDRVVTGITRAACGYSEPARLVRAAFLPAPLSYEYAEPQ